MKVWFPQNNRLRILTVIWENPFLLYLMSEFFFVIAQFKSIFYTHCINFIIFRDFLYILLMLLHYISYFIHISIFYYTLHIFYFSIFSFSFFFSEFCTFSFRNIFLLHFISFLVIILRFLVIIFHISSIHFCDVSKPCVFFHFFHPIFSISRFSSQRDTPRV